MGCVPSKNTQKVRQSGNAGYFAVFYKFRDIEPPALAAEEKPKGEKKVMKPPTKSKRRDLPVSLFGGGLSKGFGQFDTMYSKKVEEKKLEEKPATPAPSKLMDMAFVYQVPRGKLSINPYMDNTNGKAFEVFITKLTCFVV